MATDAPVDVLLDYLKRTRGFDFTGYKRASLERRIGKRMNEVGVDDYVGYLDHLEVHPEEFAFLFDTILINVTGFFRDPPAWETIQADVVPRLLEAVPDDGPIRIWCAGCSSGEETYTMAIVLAETLGEQAFCDRVKIYATDVDEVALAHARHASYSAKVVEAVPPALLERYFDRVEHRYVFRKDLRRSVIFGRNDLVQDAPISRIDVLTCRNTLMYFNAETQARILGRFHFALNDRGFLFLGKSEMLIVHSDVFRPMNLRRRVFQKVVRPTVRDRLVNVLPDHMAGTLAGRSYDLRDGILDSAPVAQVAVDRGGVLVLANGRARELLHIAATDVGRPLKDLELSYRPVDLRPSLELAFGERRGGVLASVSMMVESGETRELEVHVEPIPGDDDVLGASVVFQDVTSARRLQEKLETSSRELEGAYEELQSTVEELETTNEELQSTNEELETTNEELQSINEDLETMNEELQSTNEELETINDELRTRTLDLDEVNTFLEAILTSLGAAVVVVDRDQVVQMWNAQAGELWGLRADEVIGRHLLALDIGLPLEGLRPALVPVLAGKQPRTDVVLAARNRCGRAIECRVTSMGLVGDGGAVTGAILLMAEIGAPVGADGDGAAAAAAVAL